MHRPQLWPTSSFMERSPDHTHTNQRNHVFKFLKLEIFPMEILPYCPVAGVCCSRSLVYVGLAPPARQPMWEVPFHRVPLLRFSFPSINVFSARNFNNNSLCVFRYNFRFFFALERRLLFSPRHRALACDEPRRTYFFYVVIEVRKKRPRAPGRS